MQKQLSEIKPGSAPEQQNNQKRHPLDKKLIQFLKELRRTRQQNQDKMLSRVASVKAPPTKPKTLTLETLEPTQGKTQSHASPREP